MSEIFAEATVTLVPDTKGFATKLQAQLKEIITKIETGPRAPKIRVAPALTKNFVGDLRRQVNAAVTQAQRGVKPIRVSAVLTDVSSAAIAREVRDRARAVPVAGGIGGGVAATAAQTGALVQAMKAMQDASSKVLDTERLLGSQFGRTAQDLRVLTTQTKAANTERLRGAAGIRNVTGLIEEQTAAQFTFARAQRQAAVAATLGLTTRQGASALRRADVLAAEALTDANKNLERGLITQIDAFRNQIRSTKEGAAALGEHSAAAARTARSHSQLRRGALATGLSFLGIRGATLAASASFLAGAAAIALFAKALDNATRFTDQLNVFRATTSSTVEELEQVRDVARALGADLTLPGVTAADAAEAMTELAKAGLDVQNSIAGARGVLELATAAAIENAQAVELVANALNAFGLQGEDATRVADTFANAANAAQGSIVDIGIAFQQAAAAGRQVGLSFEDTTTFLTVLQREGLRGSDAGTSLRTALIRLIKPTKDAAEQMQKLGVETRDAAGNLRPDIFIQIAQLTRDLTKAERDRVVALVGGQDAFRAITILGRQSIQDFIRLRKELRQQGTAGELAAARMQGLRGSLEGLSNLLSSIGIRIGQSLTPGLQASVEGISGVTASMASSEQVARTFAGGLDFVSVSAGLLGTTLGALSTVLLPLAGALEQTVNAFGVPTILAAVAAYKLLPAVLARATVSMKIFAVASAEAAAVGRAGALLPFTTRLGAMVRSLNLAAIAAGGLAAGLFFLLTRESAAERATRRLTEATDELIDAQSRLRQAQESRRTARLSTAQSVLDVVNARDAAAQARARLRGAEPGTPARIRAELEYAVAVDNVAAAQQRARQIEKELADARIVAANAIERERVARDEEVRGLREAAAAARERARAELGRGSKAGRTQANLIAESARLFSQDIDTQIKKLRESDDADALRHANRLARLKLFIALTGQVPEEQAFNIVVRAPNLTAVTRKLTTEFGLTAEELKRRLVDALSGPETTSEMRAAALALLNELEPPLINKALQIGIEGGRNLGRGFAAGVDETAPEIENAVAGAVTRGLNRLRGLQRQQTRLEIAGATPAERLANVRRQEAQARATLARLEANGAAEESINRALDRLAAIVNERRAIEAEIAAAQQEANDIAQEAADRADEAALGRLERRRTRVENRLEDARETETLADDLRFTIVLRNLIRKQINRIKDLIKDRETQIQAIRALQQVELSLGREIVSLRRQRRQQIADRVAERIQLNIEFAQTTGNVAAEVRFRLREIARLKKLQDATKKGTIEYLRLRNLIAEQQRAIDDLQKQRNEGVDRAARREFEFLQTIQGFTGNLIGNLIPGAFTSGLVGGSGLGTTGPASSSASGDFFGPTLGIGRGPDGGPIPGRGTRTPAQMLAAAPASSRAFTAGQGNTTNELLRKIYAELRKLNRGSDHPEGKHQRKTGAAAGDYGGSGSANNLGM